MASTLARLTILALTCACASAQYEEERQGRYIATAPKVAVTPVPILKQINKHNEDGSYTYGYEGADGSFKIETKSPTGEVKGKYGYKDDTGKVRVVEYGANKFGFQPSGEGITVAPPTLVDETKEETSGKSSRNGYNTQQQPTIDYDYEEASPAPPQRAPRPSPAQYHAPTPSQRSTSITASRPIKPSLFSGAAPAPIEENNLFNPAPAQTQQYRAPKQDFRFQQQQFQPQIDYNQVSQPQKNSYTQTQGFSSQPSYQQSYQQPQQSYQQPQPSYQQPQQSYQQPQQSYQQPQQNYQQPQQSYQQPQSAFQQKGFSMLDQLLKEYALPQGGAAPLHDITFGSI